MNCHVRSLRQLIDWGCGMLRISSAGEKHFRPPRDEKHFPLRRKTRATDHTTVMASTPSRALALSRRLAELAHRIPHAKQRVSFLREAKSIAMVRSSFD